MLMDDLKMQICQVINQAEMSVEQVYYILKDLTEEVRVTYFDFLQEERMRRAEEIRKQNEKNTDEENKRVEEQPKKKVVKAIGKE